MVADEQSQADIFDLYFEEIIKVNSPELGRKNIEIIRSHIVKYFGADMKGKTDKSHFRALIKRIISNQDEGGE